MKLKLLLATIFGAVAVNGAVAGTYCPPPAQYDKCPVECSPDSPGYVGVSYMSDYIFRGVRYARDTVGMHASYTIDSCIIPVTLGVNHYTSLSSNNPGNRLGGPNAGGDHNNLYAAVELPSVYGFDLGLRYDHYFYPNWRTPAGAPGFGDSHGALGLTISREILCGLTLAYTAQHDFNSPSAQLPFGNSSTDNGAWIHTIDLSKSFSITDCVSLDLRGGVLYTDNMWAGGSGSQRSAGWNNYYMEAALPIAIGRCATLSPYIGYNGTPDSWLADGVPNGIPGANANDAFHGGVRLGVKF